jgi:hypothetical protein
MFACLLWIFFLATTLTAWVSYSIDLIDPKYVLGDLKTIQECKATVAAPSFGDRSAMMKRRCNSMINNIYGRYGRELAFSEFSSSTDPVKLELTYREWESSKKLQVLHELIEFSRMIPVNDRREYYELGNFVKPVLAIRDSCLPLKDSTSDDMNLLRVLYWRLRLIEPVKDTKEMLASVETKIEILSVKNALKQIIDKGKTNIELEQRISKLPEDARREIGDLRTKLLEEKSRQLAMAKAEEDRREKALKRQQEMDQAIKLRKAEIDTGKTNPTLQQQLNEDSELKSAVALWETQYRKELADKKAWEAKRKLQEIELAKKEEAREKELAAAEERRKKEAEIAERRRIDEENRIRAKLIRYNVKATVTGYDLRSNPFTYKSQSVIIRLVFDRMMESTVGVFTSGGYQILVSNLPTDLFTGAGQVADLIVKVKGTAEGTNLLGARLDVPHVEYVDILQ